jgi:hypothetical protein
VPPPHFDRCIIGRHRPTISPFPQQKSGPDGALFLENDVLSQSVVENLAFGMTPARS